MELELDWDFLGQHNMSASYNGELEFNNALVEIYVFATKHLEYETNSSTITIHNLYINVKNLYDEDGNEIYNLTKKTKLMQEFKESLIIR